MARRTAKNTAKASGRPAPKSAGKPGRKRRMVAVRKVTATRTTPNQARMTLTPSETQAYRDLFWQNVMREVLVSLIMLRVKPPQPPTPPAALASGSPVPAPGPTAVLDGRLGLITKSGQRIPIAAVYPVFSASIPQSSKSLTLSAVLQSTVFQIHTPGGEVYTLPLHEIRGFHALTEELMDQLEATARAQGEARQDDGSEAEPFGFAAFTSIARGRLPADVDEGDEPRGAD